MKTFDKEFYVIEKDGLLYGTKYIQKDTNIQLEDFVDAYKLCEDKYVREPFECIKTFLNKRLAERYINLVFKAENVDNWMFSRPANLEQAKIDFKDAKVRKVKTTTSVEYVDD